MRRAYERPVYRRHDSVIHVAGRVSGIGRDRHYCSAFIGSDQRYTGHVSDIVNLTLVTHTGHGDAGFAETGVTE